MKQANEAEAQMLPRLALSVETRADPAGRSWCVVAAADTLFVVVARRTLSSLTTHSCRADGLTSHGGACVGRARI